MSENDRLPQPLRNIAIVAHVDHGKTTLVDAMLRQSGFFRDNEVAPDRVMDSNDLERERGITILAKHCSVQHGGTTINIIDTPGHADFGGEVERTLMMADGALLLVDAAEGPLPQTRFVLGKAIAQGMPVIVVINKIDRQDARPDEVLNEAFDLFCDLGASDEQADFPTYFAIGKDGIAKASLSDDSDSLKPLMDGIIEHVPAPPGDVSAPFQLLVTNVEHDDYVGRIAVGRIENGFVEAGTRVTRFHESGEETQRISNLYGYRGNQRVERPRAEAGDIVAISGFADVQIGDTLGESGKTTPLPRISVEEPTIKVRFLANDSPMVGRSGKWVTSRHLRDRLFKEARRNLALRVEETDTAEAFNVFGRGELMLAVLAETMRREGYEFALGMPEVVVREIDGVMSEPVERVIIDIPDEYVGAVTTALGQRKGQMDKMQSLGFGRARVEFLIPSRGLIGYRSEFLTQTRGTGLLNTEVAGWQPHAGNMLRRKNGAMVSDRNGKATPYAIFHLQSRGIFLVPPGTEVYEGMIVGENARPNDMDVNVTREKKLTNHRAAGKDDNVLLTPPRELTIESGLEFIDGDELLEVTPEALRVRKKILACNRRPKRVSA